VRAVAFRLGLIVVAAFALRGAAAADDPLTALALELGDRQVDVRGAANQYVYEVRAALQGPDYADPLYRALFRPLPRTLRRLFPAEFRPDTPGDISDMTDAFVVIAADGWQSLIESRLPGLDAASALADQCGHHADRRAVAKLRKTIAAARAALDRIATGATPLERFNALYAVDVPAAEELAAHGMAPANYVAASSAFVRFRGGRPALSGYVGPEYLPSPPQTSFVDGTVGLHCLFTDRIELRSSALVDVWRRAFGLSAQDIASRDPFDGVRTYTLDLTAQDVTGPGTYPVATAALRAGRSFVAIKPPEQVLGETAVHYELTEGTLVVTESCPDWLVAKFALRLREVDGPRRTTVKSGEINVYRGP